MVNIITMKSHPVGAIFIGLLILDSISFLHADMREITHKYFSRELTNLVYYNNTVYVAGNGQLHALSENLEPVQTVTTCIGTSDLASCNNFNKVLVLNRLEDTLILCGTGNEGKCQVRLLNDLGSVGKKHGQDDDNLRVSNDSRRPAVALINERGGGLMIGVTFGLNLEAFAISDNKLTYKYALSTRKVQSPFEVDSKKSIQLSIPKQGEDPSYRKPVENFLFYYKAAFQNSRFSYFFTNQKNRIDDQEYISKMIRICQEDLQYNSYADLVVECKKDGKNYNLLQDATIVEPGSTPGVEAGDRLFVGTFTSADNPEDVSGDSAICVEKLSVLDERTMRAKREAISCSANPIPDGQRYLNQAWTCGVTRYDESFALCTANLPAYKYVIGQSPLTMSPVYMLSSDQGYITTVSAHVVEATNTVAVLAGTSRGYLIQLNLESTEKDLHEFEKFRVQKGSPVRKIHTMGGNSSDPTFIMTMSKVFKYGQTNCSKFSTCSQTMEGRNPYCGWCAYLGRSTTQEACPSKGTNHWLSSLTACLSLKAFPAGQQAYSKPGQVRLNVTKRPEESTGDKFECLFRIGPKLLLSGPATLAQMDTFLCETPALKEPAHVTLQLKVTTATGSSAILGQIPYLYYRCDQYSRCGECTNTVGASCVWCPESVTCRDETSSCGGESSITEKSECIHLLNDTENIRYIANNVPTSVGFDLSGNILQDMRLLCYIPELKMLLDAKIESSRVTCDLTLPVHLTDGKKRYYVVLRYATSQSDGRYADIDDEYNNFVTVYRCESLGKDCSHCRGLNSTRYKCDWCTSGSCGYKDGSCEPTSQCPAPVITQVTPLDAPRLGMTLVTVSGSNLGSHFSQVESMTLAGVPCKYLEQSIHFAPAGDFEDGVPDRLSCEAGKANKSSVGVAGPVEVTVNQQLSTGSVQFTYQEPVIHAISPTFGPRIGGTRVTFSGDHLGVGNKNVQVAFHGQHWLDDCEVQEHRKGNYTIECLVPTGLNKNFTNMNLAYGDAGMGAFPFKISYFLVFNPAVERITPKKTILSGGTKMTISGTHLSNAHQIAVYATYSGLVTRGSCEILSEKLVRCAAPSAPHSVREDLHGKLPDEQTRRKRDLSSQSVGVGIRVQLDGVMHNDTVQYYPDPRFDRFTEDGAVQKYDSTSQRLTLTGKYLNLVVEKYDLNVTIGAEPCTVVELTDTTLTCVPPQDQPDSVGPGLNFPEVNVTIGNLQVNIGYLEYEGNTEMMIIIAVVCTVVVIAIIIAALYFVSKFRQQGKQKMELEKKFRDIEMEIKRVAREEFHDMHTTMSTVNRNLVEQGFPYHGYQQFASSIMFASDYRLSDLGVSKAKMSEDMKKQINAVLPELEDLIMNKKFLVSVISTMEREKKFFHRERATLAGNLCAVLIGRMDYIQEVLCDLLTELVQDSISNNKHKTLFRTCERITENLLSNWLSLNMYSHFKVTSGSPLYMLYMAMLKTIESGPIDAVTHDAKYTLCEEKLLKRWDTTEAENTDVKFEAKPLTIQVVVDNGEQVYDCRALDCDTITQVKAKCLTQIYVNYPASQLNIDPTELCLEWHSGYSGSLSLKDEDASSIVDGKWKRLNTLAHYTVKDNSKLALIDPKSAEADTQESYANLPEVKVSLPSHNNRISSEVSSAGSPHDEENPLLMTLWHLVKRSDEAAEQPERSVLEDLYLNRLFTTKQSILDYMNKLFSAILDEANCPPPTKFLYDFLDDLGEKNKVDPDVIHAWKSHSYPIRVWGTLLKQPSKLFDINVPVYVEDSLDIIAQVFIESFNLTPQKFTKDSSAQKLIFHQEMNQYREKVKAFYSGVSNVQQTTEKMKDHLATVNSQQQSFKKLTYLKKFYTQLKPYTEQILDDLEEIDAKLARKFEDLLEKMEPNDEEEEVETV